MDKYEFNLKIDQMKKLIEREDYKTALRIVEGIDWNRVRNTNLLTMASTVYEKNDMLAEAKDMLILAFERAPVGKHLLFKLTELSCRNGDLEEAEDYYREYRAADSTDIGNYLLQYMILKARHSPYERQLLPLERYCEADPDETWLWELASVYESAGRIDDCVKICDRLALLYGASNYGMKAVRLKARYAALTDTQKNMLYPRSVPIENNSTARPAAEAAYGYGAESENDGYQNAADNITPISPINSFYGRGSAANVQAQADSMDRAAEQYDTAAGYNAASGYNTAAAYDTAAAYNTAAYNTGSVNAYNAQSTFRQSQESEYAASEAETGSTPEDVSSGITDGRTAADDFRKSEALAAERYVDEDAVFDAYVRAYASGGGRPAAGTVEVVNGTASIVDTGFNSSVDDTAEPESPDGIQMAFDFGGEVPTVVDEKPEEPVYDEMTAGSTDAGADVYRNADAAVESSNLNGTGAFGTIAGAETAGNAGITAADNGMNMATQNLGAGAVAAESAAAAGSVISAAADTLSGGSAQNNVSYSDILGRPAERPARPVSAQDIAAGAQYAQQAMNTSQLPQAERYEQQTKNSVQYAQNVQYAQPAQFTQNTQTAQPVQAAQNTQNEQPAQSAQNTYNASQSNVNTGYQDISPLSAAAFAQAAARNQAQQYNASAAHAEAAYQVQQAGINQVQQADYAGAAAQAASLAQPSVQAQMTGQAQQTMSRPQPSAAPAASAKPGYESLHMIVEARTEAEGLSIAIDELKNIHEELKIEHSSIKTSAEKLNVNGITQAIIDRVTGKDFVIENAGTLSTINIETIYDFICQDRTGTIVVLIDTPEGLDRIESIRPELFDICDYISDIDDEEAEDGNKGIAVDDAVPYNAELAQNRTQAAAQAQDAEEYDAQSSDDEPYDEAEEAEYDDDAYDEDEEEPEERNGSAGTDRTSDRAPGRDDRASDRHAADSCTESVSDEEEAEADTKAADDAETEHTPVKRSNGKVTERFNNVREVDLKDLDRELDIDEFAQACAMYAARIDCSIPGTSMLALYERIELMEENDIKLTARTAQELIEEAADRAERPPLGKRLTGMFRSKYDKNGLLILKEDDFIY